MDPDDMDGLLDFASVRTTTITPGASVLATLRGTEGDAGANEEAADCEVWGVAGVQSRPPDATAAGSAEVVMVRGADELLGVTSRDLRWQVEVAKGEVAVHALGRDGARQGVIRFQADGTVRLEGVEVLIDATAFVRVEPGGYSAARAEAVANAFATHTHPETGGTTGVPDAPSIAAMNAAGSSKLSIPV